MNATQTKIQALRNDRNTLRAQQNVIAPIWQDVDARLYAHHRAEVQVRIDKITEEIFALCDTLEG